MTLLQIQTAAAAYHKKTVADLTINALDLGLLALNQARLAAEMQFDWEFERTLAILSVDGVTGGSLDAATAYGTVTPALVLGEILDIGLFDTTGNLIPIEWTTVADSLIRQREDNWSSGSRYPTDAQLNNSINGDFRIVLMNNKAYAWPKAAGQTYSIGIESYVHQADWTSTAVTDIWTTKGSQYLLWETIVQLNYYFKTFVPRQEGNLLAPEKLSAAGLTALQTWDSSRFDQNRRHDR